MTADNRNPETLQQLSALVDGELERDQARFLFKRLADDPELSGAWQRWHVAGECLRGHGPTAVRAEFMANISLAIADDATPGRGVSRETLKWLGGFAVAASVALAALMAVRPGTDASAPGTQPLIAVVSTNPAAPAVEVAPSPYREQDLRPAWREESMTVANEGGANGLGVRIDPRVESYLVRHNEATAAQGQGFVPYVPLVAPVRERVPRGGFALMRVARRLVLLAGLLAAAPGFAQDANAWLARMGQALAGLDYQGEFVYLHGGQLESLRVYHAVDGNGPRERLVSLSGAPREIVRGGGQVLLSGSRPRAAVYGEPGTLQPQLLAALGADPERVLRHYQLALGGVDRIAGLSTQLLEIRPRDSFRYGYRLWLESDTGMLLKSVRFAADGRPVEQLMFTRIALRERPSDADLAGTPAADPLPNPMNLPQRDSGARAAWSVENVPEGFDLALRQPAPVAGTEHLIYSDGLASVSVYVEPLTRAAPAFSGTSNRGAINLHGRVLDGHQITVLGDVPAATVERFAQGVVAATGS